jgi:hypothetical protein
LLPVLNISRQEEGKKGSAIVIVHSQQESKNIPKILLWRVIHQYHWLELSPVEPSKRGILKRQKVELLKFKTVFYNFLMLHIFVLHSKSRFS